MIKLSSIFALLAFATIMGSCSSIESIQGADKAETFYLRGVAYLEDSMYREALERFNIVKNKFPYSKYAVDAELRIGDTYYKKRDYVEAQRIFSMFSELRPGHPKRDYAIYYSGMCFYRMTPSAIDRDLSPAFRGIAEFRKLIDEYPDSSYLDKAIDKHTDLRTRLAKKEIYIGDFYRTRRKYEAAIDRYNFVINNYANLGLEQKMYYFIAKTHFRSGNKEGMEYYTNLAVATDPDGKYAEKARKLEKRGRKSL